MSCLQMTAENPAEAFCYELQVTRLQDLQFRKYIIT